MGALILFLMGFVYGYLRKRRHAEGFGFVGYFIVLASLAVSFLYVDVEQDKAFNLFVFLFTFSPALLFVLGNFAGRRMDIL